MSSAGTTTSELIFLDGCDPASECNDFEFQSYADKRRASTRERVRKYRARQKTLAHEAEQSVGERGDETTQVSIVENNGLEMFGREAQRFTADIARKIAFYTVEQLQGVHVSLQNEIIDKFLRHSLVQESIPDYLKDLHAIRQNHEVVQNLKSGIAEHLVGAKQSQIVMAKDIVCTLASSHSIKSSRATAALLGVDRRNIKRGMDRRFQLDSEKDVFWIKYKRQPRSDCITEMTVKVVIEWWSKQTQISPNRKDIRRRLLSPKNYESHPTHYLQISELEFFTAFKVKFPESKIQFTKFHSLKPWFVRRLLNWNTCCCRYHTEIRYMLDGLNDMRVELKEGVHKDCGCSCYEVCGQGTKTHDSRCCATTATFSGLTDLCASVLCDKGDNEVWHKLACLMGTCIECGVDQNLKLCPQELTSERLVKWKCFGKEHLGHTEEGKERSAVIVECKETQPSVLIGFLKPRLQFFVKHNFFARWQDQEFNEQLKNLPADTILSCVDFSENYSMKQQNEIQTMHWKNTQVTILVMITYRLNHAFDPKVHDSPLLKDIHYFISDDRKHDNAFVQHAFLLHWEFQRKRGCFPRNHIVWSDGCSAQFKSSRAWYFVARYPSLTKFGGMPNGCSMIWNFFASGHGKGEVDGAGALCKRAVRNEQLKPNAVCIQNAAQMVSFLKAESAKFHTYYPGARRHVNKHFWEVPKTAVKRAKAFDASRIVGSRGMHQVRSISCNDPTLVQFRMISCSCVACVQRDGVLTCENSSHVPAWTIARLEGDDHNNVRKTMIDELQDLPAWTPGLDYEEHVQVGENLACISDDADDPFWILLVDKSCHEVQDTFTDGWQNTFVAGQKLIRGYWYQRYSDTGRSYHLRTDKPVAYVCLHSVLASKFSMPPTAHFVKGSLATYELTERAMDVISRALERARLLDSE